MNTDCNCGVIIESPKENQIVVNLNGMPAVNISNGAIPLLSEYAKYYEEILEARDNVVNLVAHKQDKLIAGTNISINGNVISATNSVPAETIQQITDNQNAIAQQQREIDALIKMQGGAIYNFERQETEAHVLDVPSGAKMCDILEIEGKSYVLNQLINPTLARAESGTTFSVNGNEITFTNTVSGNGIQFSQRTYGGHKYYARMSVYADDVIDVRLAIGLNLDVITSAGQWVEADTVIGATDRNVIYIYPANSVSKQIKVKDVILIDLTKANLEHLTVEQCRKAFDKYIPYNEGSLENVKTDKVINVGKNLLNTKAEISTPSATTSSNATKRKFVKGTWVKGLAVNNYYSPSNCLVFETTDNSVSVACKSGYGAGYALKDVKAGDTVTLSVGDVSDKTYNNYAYLTCYNSEGEYIKYLTPTLIHGGSKTYTIPANTEYVMALFVPDYNYSGNTTITFSDVQVVKGGATAYSPYKETTTPIIPFISQAEALRYQAETIKDEIDYKNRRMLRRVGRVDLGSLTWGYYSNSYFSAKLWDDAPAFIAEVMTVDYPHIISWSIFTQSAMGIYTETNRANIYIRDTRYTDANAFKSAMAGKVLYYELTTPTYEDLSSVIPAEASVLDCYGAGVNEASNRIYQAEGKWYYEQRMSSVDLGTLSYVIIPSTNPNWRIYATLNGAKAEANSTIKSNALCSKYETVSTDKVYDHIRDKVISTHYNIGQVWIYDTTFADATNEQIKQALSGVMFYYELANPIVTDITDLVQASAFKVEAGGTITLHNTDDSSIPIKNSIEYATLLKEVARYE